MLTHEVKLEVHMNTRYIHNESNDEENDGIKELHSRILHDRSNHQIDTGKEDKDWNGEWHLGDEK